MVQTALAAWGHWWAAWGAGLRGVGAVLGLLFVGWLLLGLLDRERFRAGLDWAGRHWRRGAAWALTLLALGLGAAGLRLAWQAADLRLASQQSARYANAADPDGGETVQAAPRATYLEDQTYTRSLVLPQRVLTQIRVDDGWAELLPYLGMSESEGNLKELREGFTEQRNALVYTRQAVMVTERPVSLDSSTVNTDLKFVEPAGGRGTYYNAAFQGAYTFSNPTDAPRTMRFAFPLPTGSGTLSDFRLTVNGEAFRADDLIDGSVWEGEVPAGGVVKVAVSYRNQGARTWSYQLGQRREAIKQFALTIHSDRAAKFNRYSLFPTAQSSENLGRQHTLTWKLSDVITAQDVSVVFQGSNLREVLGKIGLFKPFAALLSLAVLVLWGLSRRLSLTPLPLAGALLGLCLGWALGSVLGFYVPVWAAELLGAAAAGGLLVWVLGRPYAGAAALVAPLPLVFLTGGHASLLLILWALTALVWLLGRSETALFSSR